MTRSRVVAAVIALVVIAGVVAGIVLNQRAAVPQVSVETAEVGTLAVSVSASGKVAADAKADVYPPTAGTLESIEVAEGQEVAAGEVIATLDTAPLDLQVAQATAAYEAALAQAEAAGAGAPSSADERAAQAAVSAAYAAYEAASKQYELAKLSGVDPTALAQAQAALALAQAAADAAVTAYDTFKTSVYDPAPEPKAPELTAALEALATARDQAAALLASEETNLRAVQSAAPNPVAIATAKAARDQAWAGYLAAVAQAAKLAATDLGPAASAADAGVNAARLALELAVANRDRAVLRAPVAGTVLFNSAAGSLSGALGGGAAGGKPTVGSAVSPASAPFSVVAFDRLVFVAQVDEADIARIKVGQPVAVVLDALAEEQFDATVERIDRTASTTVTGGTAFSVTCRLSDVGEDALLGMNGAAEIQVESIEGALTVPVEAVLDEAGESYVFLIEDDHAVRTTVTVGRLTDTRVEIIDGIAEGDAVAVSGLVDLVDGASVKVK